MPYEELPANHEQLPLTHTLSNMGFSILPKDSFDKKEKKIGNWVLQSGQTTLFLVMHLYTVHSVTVVYKHSYFQT